LSTRNGALVTTSGLNRLAVLVARRFAFRPLAGSLRKRKGTFKLCSIPTPTPETDDELRGRELVAYCAHLVEVNPFKRLAAWLETLLAEGGES